jgi:hypothetical protein
MLAPRVVIGAVLASALVVGCRPDGDDALDGTDDNLLAVNGLSMINGLSMTNGLANGNGLSMVNGLTSSTGLASGSGLMTTTSGRITLGYVVRCALPAGHSVSKKDQNGTSYTFAGLLGLAPNWENNACDTACQETVSACMMAHVNVAGVHVPIWFDSPVPSIGYGSNSSYPNEEGTFFGNVFITGSNGKVPAYYCEGSGFAKGIVPGRLGATTSAAGIFTNPFGSGALCSAHCSAAPGSSKGQGYSSCNGYTRPITVWRAASYRPVFDSVYAYRLVNAQSGLAMDVSAASTSDGVNLIEYVPSTTKPNQQFRIVATASSTWKLIAVHSGKAVTGTGSNDHSPVQQSTYNGSSSQQWGIDDHNGHFKVINKNSLDALETPSGNKNSGTGLDTSAYTGASNQDWDLFATVP